MELSCCLLVKNEEERINECLRSIKQYADEIIVVDNGSTDRTVEISKKYTDKIFKRPNGEMDANRNLYIQQAKCPWILALDADECILEVDIQKIKNYLDTVSDECFGITLNRFEYLGEGRWAAIKILRLFRNDKRIYYNSGTIHTSVRYSINQIGGKVGNLDFAIHHFDILCKNRTANKRMQYVVRIEKELKNISEGDKYRVALMNYLATEYCALGEYDKAIELLKDNLGMNKNKKENDVGKPMTLVYLTQCYIRKNCLHDALDMIEQLLLFENIDKDFYERAYLLKSEILYRKGQINETIELCTKLLEMNPFAAHYYINLASLILEENPETALEYVLKAIKLNPCILDEAIYKDGEKPNIFDHQTSFLSSTDNIMNKFKKIFG